jgi:ligand-binding sensor domain-containing protein
MKTLPVDSVEESAGVQSTSFRLVWGIVTILLLVALVAIIRSVWVNHPASPTWSFTTSTTATPIDVAGVRTPGVATSTPEPTPTSLPTVALGAEQRIRIGGYSFRPLAEYIVEVAGSSTAMMSSGHADSRFELLSGPTDQFADSPQAVAADLLTTYVDAYSVANDLRVDGQFTTTVAGLPAVGVELASHSGNSSARGLLVLVQPAPGRYFVMKGEAPVAEWPTAERQFDAVLSSLQFFDVEASSTPTATAEDHAPASPATPTATATSGRAPSTPRAVVNGPWQSYTNANLANAVTATLNTIWVATDGGVIAWNKNSGSYIKYTTLDGLAANRTTAVVNCPLRGFGVVFGSEAGLQIFDLQNNDWKVLNSSNSGMSFDDVTALHCEVDNRYLVVGYKQHGLDIFDASVGAWRYVGQNDGLQNNLVDTLAVVGNQESIWVSSGLGISVLSAGGQPSFYDEATSPLETNQIRRIVVTEDGAVWLGAQDALYKVQGEDWTIYDARSVLASPFPGGALNGLAAAADGTLWIGSSRGEICHFDPVRVACQDFYAAEPGMVAGELTSLSIGGDGAIYYTTAGGGVSMYAGGRWRAFAIPDEPLFGNEIHSMAETGDGNLWVATERGIQAINPHSDAIVRQFTRDNSALSSATKEVLHPAPEGGVWFGALGASYFNGISWRSYTTADGLAGSLVQAIATDSQGRTWFGTESGLSIWNSSTFFNLTRENGLPGDNIATLLADDEIMWISAVGGGLFRFEKNQLQLFSPENSALPSNTISAMAIAQDGALLLGHSRGLARFEDGEVTPIPELAGYAVSAIATAPGGVIWVGTAGDGLVYFDGEAWTPAPAGVQPPSPQITNILVGADGSVWVGSRSGGLIRYQP